MKKPSGIIRGKSQEYDIESHERLHLKKDRQCLIEKDILLNDQMKRLVVILKLQKNLFERLPYLSNEIKSFKLSWNHY